MKPKLMKPEDVNYVERAKKAVEASKNLRKRSNLLQIQFNKLHSEQVSVISILKKKFDAH